MLQNALRRVLLHSAGLQQVGASSSYGAASIRLGNSDQSSSSGTGDSRAYSRATGFQPDFHVPSLFGVSSNGSTDDGKPAPTQPAVGRGAMPLGLCTRSTGLQTPFAARGYHALRQLQSLACAMPRRSVPLGLGLGLGTPSTTALQARSYHTEGEMLGAAYLLTTDIMFWSGLIGAVVFRRNIIVMLLCTEILMLACNMNFLFASAYLNDMTGVIMSITITTIAACETAIGLALCVTYFHIRSATDVEALNLLK